MQQEDFLIREIQRFAQFLSMLLSKSARAQALQPKSDEFFALVGELLGDERTQHFFNPTSSEADLQEALKAPYFEQKNIEKLAELMIHLGQADAENATMYFQRARFLLNQPAETVSLHRLELMEQIPD